MGRLKLFLVISARLSLNNIELVNLLKFWMALFLLILFAACSAFKGKINVDTQIFCQNGANFLIKDVRESDLRRAIKEAYNNKKRYKTSEDYTPIRLRDGRSLMMSKIPPEEMVNCFLREVSQNIAEGSYNLM